MNKRIIASLGLKKTACERIPTTLNRSDCKQFVWDTIGAKVTFGWGCMATPVVAAGAMLISSGAILATYHYADSADGNKDWKWSDSSAENTEKIRTRKGIPSNDSNNLVCSFYSSRGKRSCMEDSFFVSQDSRFVGVYDGHGGPHVSAFLSEQLHKLLEKEMNHQQRKLDPSTENKDIRAALSETFRGVERHVMKHWEWDNEGSTATVIWLDDRDLWTAHVGDSRAILCRRGQAMPITTDHKPDVKEEKERIEKLGGSIEWFGLLDENGMPRAGHGVYRVNGNLTMTRAIGDRPEKPYITADPVITRIDRDFAIDQFILVASDGLWDVFDNQKAVDIVQEFVEENYVKDTSATTELMRIENSLSKKQNVAQHLVKEAYRHGASDNITAVVVWLG